MMYPVVVEGSQDGGGGAVTTPEVNTFADLPASTASGNVYLVLTDTYLAFPPKLSGFYKDEATGWVRKAPYSAYFLDTKAVWYDDGDNTKRLDFQLDQITTGNTRTITMADADINLGTDFVRVDGILPLTANWDVGPYDISLNSLSNQGSTDLAVNITGGYEHYVKLGTGDVSSFAVKDNSFTDIFKVTNDNTVTVAGAMGTAAIVATGSITSDGFVQRTGAIWSFTALANSDIIHQLGDNAGANSFSWYDSDGVNQGSIDSNGGMTVKTLGVGIITGTSSISCTVIEPAFAVRSNTGNYDWDSYLGSTTTDFCFYLDAGASNITINATPVSANYDLMLAGDGVLGLKETTTPTADTNYGKVYCKSDNILYFQDGAGVEHDLITDAGGDVVGPGSATDNALAKFDTTTGKLIQNSVAILTDAGALTGLTGATILNAATDSLLTIECSDTSQPRLDLTNSAGDWRTYVTAAGDFNIYNLGQSNSIISIDTLTATSMIAMSATTLVINEGGADVDVRIESDTNTNLFRTDAGNGRIGILEAAPSTELEVLGTIKAVDSDNGLVLCSTSATEGGQFILAYPNTDVTGQANGTWMIDCQGGSADGDFRIFEQESGGTVKNWLRFDSNPGAQAVIDFNFAGIDMDFRARSDISNNGIFMRASDGRVTINGLSGSGSRWVQVDSSGVLSATAGV